MPGDHWQRFDSMALDSDGNLCVATLMHGGITVIAPEGGPALHVPLPDRFTTSICFGCKDMRTAYVTLSGRGRLVAIDEWPPAGLKLNFEA